MIDPYSDPPLTLKETLAREAEASIVPTVVRGLQALRGENLQAGDDSGLRDVWEEICVQMQHQLSPLWHMYEMLVERLVLEQLRNVPRTSLHAMWLETIPGQEWLDERATEDASDPGPTGVELVYGEDDVVVYLRDRVMNKADVWSNRRIERYLERR